jgi:hypothetical protein
MALLRCISFSCGMQFTAGITLIVARYAFFCCARWTGSLQATPAKATREESREKRSASQKRRRSAQKKAGQQVTDADHRARLEYVFKGNGGAPSLPSLDDLREKVDHARKDVDKLRTQFVCACCDELFPLDNFSSHSIEDPPSDLWAVLSDEGVPEDMNQTLRAQYNLTEYNDSAHEEWSSLVISPLSIYDDDGCVSVRLCDGCSSLLATKSMPKLAVRNHLWLGKSPHMTMLRKKMTFPSLVPLLPHHLSKLRDSGFHTMSE